MQTVVGWVFLILLPIILAIPILTWLNSIEPNAKNDRFKRLQRDIDNSDDEEEKMHGNTDRNKNSIS